MDDVKGHTEKERKHPRKMKSKENLQNCSLKRLRSPEVGWNEGKSNMMAPLDQSAPSEVLEVVCPRKSS